MHPDRPVLTWYVFLRVTWMVFLIIFGSTGASILVALALLSVSSLPPVTERRAGRQAGRRRQGGAGRHKRYE